MQRALRSCATSTLSFVNIVDRFGLHRTHAAVHVCQTTPVEEQHPMMVLIGGTAQSIGAYVGHTRQFTESGRQVLQYETRGQGKTQLSLRDATLETHVEDFANLMDALKIEGPVDLCGFSFGGRVSLAIAASMPEKVRRLVVTGVPADRGALARCTLRGWLSALEKGNLEAMVWCSIVETHSERFLAQHESRVADWVQQIVQANTAGGLHAIVSQTHHDDPNHPYHTVSLSERVQCPTLLLVGKEDRMAPEREVQRLADLRGWRTEVIPKAGHMLPLERPVEWRRAVLSFLDTEDLPEASY
eukprot:m.107755 g.107755  ORF g.107755 m.107755 type:complete len:301 (+) comp19063_c0_seq1:115-1017(+)